SAPRDLEQWLAFQRWLASGVTLVFVPYADVLQELIENHYSIRLRRDYNQLLDAIKAHALLHRQHRRRSLKGAIVATINDDYAKVQPLMAEIMATAAEMKVSSNSSKPNGAPAHLGREEAALYSQIVRSYQLHGDEVSLRILEEGLASLQRARLAREV